MSQAIPRSQNALADALATEAATSSTRVEANTGANSKEVFYPNLVTTSLVSVHSFGGLERIEDPIFATNDIGAAGAGNKV